MLWICSGSASLSLFYKLIGRQGSGTQSYAVKLEEMPWRKACSPPFLRCSTLMFEELLGGFKKEMGLTSKGLVFLVCTY